MPGNHAPPCIILLLPSHCVCGMNPAAEQAFSQVSKHVSLRPGFVCFESLPCEQFWVRAVAIPPVTVFVGLFRQCCDKCSAPPEHRSACWGNRDVVEESVDTIVMLVFAALNLTGGSML